MKPFAWKRLRVEETMTQTAKHIMACAAAIAALVAACVTFYGLGLGLVPVYIIGGPGLLAVFFWYRTYLQRPTDPAIIVPLFLLTAAGFEIHLVEEYLGHYGPAISRLFNVAWTDGAFVVICCLLAAALCLISVGLYHRVAMTGFLALLFLFTRLAELGLFIFPLLRPALEPEIARSISQSVASGIYVADMPNHYWRTTGSYYFPGMYTVALAILPALYALYRIWKAQSSVIASRPETVTDVRGRDRG
jgi:hypothetical protein